MGSAIDNFLAQSSVWKWWITTPMLQNFLRTLKTATFLSFVNSQRNEWGSGKSTLCRRDLRWQLLPCHNILVSDYWYFYLIVLLLSCIFAFLWKKNYVTPARSRQLSWETFFCAFLPSFAAFLPYDRKTPDIILHIVLPWCGHPSWGGQLPFRHNICDELGKPGQKKIAHVHSECDSSFYKKVFWACIKVTWQLEQFRLGRPRGNEFPWKLPRTRHRGSVLLMHLDQPSIGFLINWQKIWFGENFTFLLFDTDNIESIPDICHKYHKLNMWRKICHVEKFQICMHDRCEKKTKISPHVE